MTVLYSSCSTKFKNHWLEDGKGKLQTIIFERAETSPSTMFHDLTFMFKYCQKEIQQKIKEPWIPDSLDLLFFTDCSPPLSSLLHFSLSPQISQTQVMHTLKLWVFFIFTKMQISEKDLFAFWNWSIDSVQFSSVTQLCPTLCDHMNHSMPGLPVQHQLPEFTQTHVHQVSDAVQPSHPRSSPSPPVPNPSQHQGLFQWVNSSHEVAKVLEFQL